MAKIREAISSTIITALIIGSFVGLVIIALVFTYFGAPVQTAPCASSQQTTGICLTNIQLYSGSPSRVTLATNCTGDATLVIHGDNLGNRTVHISNIMIFGGSLTKNSTTLVSISNACLSLSDGNPEIPPQSFFSFVGYVNSSLVPETKYEYQVRFDNGQNSNGSIIAQI